MTKIENNSNVFYFHHILGRLYMLNLTNRPLHGSRRHLGCEAVATKIAANIWVFFNFQPDNSAIVHRIVTKKMSFKRYWHGDYVVEIERIDYV